MQGYRPRDDWSRADAKDKPPHKRISGWWALIALALGLPATIVVGRYYPGGTAEIAGIMVASLTVCVRAFWDFRVKRWFIPLVIAWTTVHVAIMFFFVIPMKLPDSKALIQLVWVEFFAFAGILWLASRLWGGLPGASE